MISPPLLETLVSDIRDCARRARELTDPALAASLHEVADKIERSAAVAAERPSLPPAEISNSSTNQEIRAMASRHFQETQRILRAIR